MNKVVASADEAIRDITDGVTIMIGGFGLCGIPENLIAALVRKGVKNLTTISNNVGIDDFGLGKCLAAGQIVRHIGSYVNPRMATAARVTIAEVEELVEVGKLDPDKIMTPSVYVKRIFQGEKYEKRIERRTVRKRT